MTDRQRRFADEYLIDCNATRAYKAAYPAVKRDKTATSAAARLLTFVDVAEYIRDRQQERARRIQVTQDRVVQALCEIAFSEERRTCDRLRALELLMRHLGMYGKDALDREEQEARIAKLRADTRAAGETGHELVVRFVDMDELEPAQEVTRAQEGQRGYPYSQ